MLGVPDLVQWGERGVVNGRGVQWVGVLGLRVNFAGCLFVHEMV